jgi:hypothetical protein
LVKVKEPGTEMVLETGLETVPVKVPGKVPVTVLEMERVLERHRHLSSHRQ